MHDNIYVQDKQRKRAHTVLSVTTGLSDIRNADAPHDPEPDEESLDEPPDDESESEPGLAAGAAADAAAVLFDFALDRARLLAPADALALAPIPLASFSPAAFLFAPDFGSSSIGAMPKEEH